MSPETEGKIMVAMIISLIAFGLGSGVGIVIGISQNDTSSPFSLNFTPVQNPQMPVIIPETTNLPDNETYASSADSSGTKEVYIPNNNKNTPSPTNNNKNDTESN